MSEPATQAAIIIAPELEAAVSKTGLTVDGATHLRDSFAPHFQRFHALKDDAGNVPQNAPKKARVIRLELKAIRVAADKTRKELKEDSLRRGKAIDGINALLEYQLVPVENAMEAIEKAEEIAEAARREALKVERAGQLAPYADATFYDLANMPPAQWDQLLAGAKAAHEAKAAAIANAEADRIAHELAVAEAERLRREGEAAERERMRAENERLAKVAAQEREAREKSERAAAAEREAAAAKAAAERKEADRLAAIERKKRDDEAAALKAKAAAEKAEADRIAADERQKREAAEAKLAEQEAARAEKEKADAAKAKKAAAAPDRAKVFALAKSINDLIPPDLTSDAGQALKAKIRAQITKFASWLEVEADKL